MALSLPTRTPRRRASELVVEQYPTTGGHKVQLIEIGTPDATTYGYDCTGCAHRERPASGQRDRVLIGGLAEAHAMTCRRSPKS
jgi:hypothetical protein